MIKNSLQFASYPSLRDRVVIVTGGASGIGEAIVLAFAHQHARVVFLDLNENAGRALVQKIDDQNLRAPEFYPCDLTDVEGLERTLRLIIQAHQTVDILINNAGDDTRHTIDEVSSASWDRIMAINLKQQFFMCQGVLPVMKAAKRGSIINMSSIGWMIPSTGVPVYVTAKAAILGMTRTLAHEVGADNIRVNCVLPGAILTERQARLWFTEEYKAEILRAQALKRMLNPDEVARLVLFLASDDSSGITNQSYVIDGGWV